MERRTFLTMAAAGAAAAQAGHKTLVCLLDGFGPEYLERSEMPFLRRMMREGKFGIGEGAMPSVTNVNNASLATSVLPAKHGITANTFFDREKRQVLEMSDSRYLLTPTLFRPRSALVAAKEKVRLLLGARADVAWSCEKPVAGAVAIAGAAPGMYTAEANYWCFALGRALLRRPDVDLLYLTTTDYMMHTYAPESAESLAHLHRLDRLLEDIVEDHPQLRVYLTADHGMNAKTEAVDPVRVLAAAGIASLGVPPIRDAHKVHHNDLGGSLNLDLEDPRQLPKAMDRLRAERGIDGVYTREEAAKKFSLYAPRLGDLFVTAERTVALGLLPERRMGGTVRTHGSTHETQVPLLAWGAGSRIVKTIPELTAGREWEKHG